MTCVVLVLDGIIVLIINISKAIGYVGRHKIRIVTAYEDSLQQLTNSMTWIVRTIFQKGQQYLSFVLLWWW